MLCFRTPAAQRPREVSDSTARRSTIIVQVWLTKLADANLRAAQVATMA